VTQVQPADSAIAPAKSATATSLAGARIVALDCFDVRFPTSLEHDGSDAMNTDPDYSAAYAVLRTDAPGLEGHALCFTIGRGNEVMVTAVDKRCVCSIRHPSPKNSSALRSAITASLPVGDKTVILTLPLLM